MGLLAVAVLATGSIAAVDQRREQAREREAAAVQAFREDLRPIAEAVFDALQPLKEAERQSEDDASGGFSVYVDVTRDATTGEVVRAQRRAFDALRVPLSQRRTADRLEAALEDFATAVGRYEDLPFDDTTGTISLLGATRAATGPFREGLATWSAAVGDLYPSDPPAVPVPFNDDTEPARRPVSHAAYLLQAGRVCGRADAAGESGQEEPSDGPSAVRSAAKEAALVRDLVRDLLAVPAPPGDRARLARDVLLPLREFGELAGTLDRLASERTTTEALFRELVAADDAGSEVALGLGDYGSEACALFFGS